MGLSPLPGGLHLECSSSFFIVEKKLTLLLDDSCCDLDSVLSFSCLEGVQSEWKKTFFLDGTGDIVETDGRHTGINFLSSTILEEVSEKCTLAKVTKNLFFLLQYVHH